MEAEQLPGDVEKVLERKLDGRRVFYKVKFLGQPDCNSIWTSRVTLKNHDYDHLVRQFEKRRKVREKRRALQNEKAKLEEERAMAKLRAGLPLNAYLTCNE